MRKSNLKSDKSVLPNNYIPSLPLLTLQENELKFWARKFGTKLIPLGHENNIKQISILDSKVLQKCLEVQRYPNTNNDQLELTSYIHFIQVVKSI